MKLSAQQNRIKNLELRIKNIFNFYSEFINYKSAFCAKSAGFSLSRTNGQTGFTLSETNGQTGFTLVEILVAITILVTLIGGVFLTLNPIAQINKSQDAQRLSDLQSVKAALDLYYNDTKCYPNDGTLQFGSKWSVGKTVYMSKLPEDPSCKNGQGTCYKYKTVSNPSDPSYACPQWNVVFAQLTKPSAQTSVCPLSSLSSCTPAGYSSSWACTMSGAVDCSGLLASSLTGGSSVTSIPTRAPSISPTPTTAPTGSVTYRNITYIRSNPYIKDATIMPLYQTVGKGQAIQVSLVDGAPGATVNSVKVVLSSDTQGVQLTLHPDPGTNNLSWSGAWTVTDTYNTRYGYDITATDDKGNTQTGSIRIKN
jgi:prepilin-type N-terminal cleavage/methylation domain-containing protein